jgi:hypothetical protein
MLVIQVTRVEALLASLIFPALCSNDSDASSDYGARLSGSGSGAPEHVIHDGLGPIPRL